MQIQKMGGVDEDDSDYVDSRLYNNEQKQKKKVTCSIHDMQCLSTPALPVPDNNNTLAVNVQIDIKLVSECKHHNYYETLVPSSVVANKSIRVTKCHNCSQIFPYSHSKL